MVLLVIFTIIGFAQAQGIGFAQAQGTKEAVETVKKIDAVLTMGISFIDYGRLMGESNYVMQGYLNKAKNEPLDNAIKEAWGLYVLAKRTWTNIEGEPARYISRSVNQTEFDALMKIPGMSKTIVGGSIAVELALPIIWENASKKVKLITSLTSNWK